MQKDDTGPGSRGNEGPIILVVGILGLFMQALGPVAWVWGNQALKRAKPAEAGLVRAGLILGIIDSVILVLGVAVAIGYYILLVNVIRPEARFMNGALSSVQIPAAPAPAQSHASKPPVRAKTHPVSSQ